MLEVQALVNIFGHQIVLVLQKDMIILTSQWYINFQLLEYTHQILLRDTLAVSQLKLLKLFRVQEHNQYMRQEI